MPGHDPRQRRQRLLGAILVIAGQKDDVLAKAWALLTLINDEVGVGLGGAGRRLHCENVHKSPAKASCSAERLH